MSTSRAPCYCSFCPCSRWSACPGAPGEALRREALTAPARQEALGIAALDRLQLGGREAAFAETAHMILGLAERKVGSEQELGDVDELSDRGHRVAMRGLGGVVVELLQVADDAVGNARGH